MKKFLAVVLLGILLTGCSGLDIAKGLVSSGDIIPDVASVQVGKTNSKTIGSSENTDFSIGDVNNSVVRPMIRPSGIVSDGKVDEINQNNYNIPFSWIVYAVLWSIFLWELPRFSTILRRLGFGKQNQQDR